MKDAVANSFERHKQIANEVYIQVLKTCIINRRYIRKHLDIPFGVEIRVFFSDSPPKGNVPAHIRELAFRVDVRKFESIWMLRNGFRQWVIV